MENAEEPYNLRIQKYNNNIIDEKVRKTTQGETYTPNWFNMETTLFKYNAPLIMSKYQKIINSPYVDTNKIQNVLIKNKARNLTTDISKLQLDRISKNIDYIDKVLKDVTINIKQYNQAARNFPTLNRANILQKAVEKGTWKGQELNYRQLDQMSKGLNKHITNKSEQEKWKLANEQATSKGFDEPRPYKVWIWSQLENTRHEDMDGTCIPITEKFTVTNSQTGDTDDLEFAGDIENDNNNCSNICNCECSTDYLTKEEASEYL